MNSLISLNTIRSVVTFCALSYFAFLPNAQAVVPPPDGGYPNFNTAEGQNALFNLTAGVGNTAAGWHSLFANTAGNLNTAIGAGTLLFNTGDNNTASGALALLSNTTGFFNTANGADALSSNTSGSENTANGEEALRFNTIGDSNTAMGLAALFSNTEGNGNTATGNQALVINTTGNRNTAIGIFALAENTTGSFNTAVGNQTLQNNTSGSFNIGLRGGFNLTTGNFNIDIGNDGVAGESGTIRIGDGCCQNRTFIAGIYGVLTGMPTAVPVLVDSAGQLGTSPSSRRFKKEIKPMDCASEGILAVKPVTFHYKSDKTNTPQFGLIAEDVAAVNRDLVVRDENGEIYTVRYDAVNAMLLNEFLKEHRKNEEQQKQINVLTAQLNEQAAQIQKVSAQLEASKPAPQVVSNNR